MKAVLAVIFLLFILVFTSFSQPDYSSAQTSCSSLGGFCYPHSACLAEGGTPRIGTNCASTLRCCVIPTATPTITPRPPCSSFAGGFCFQSGACAAEGGTTRNASGCGSNVCCVIPTATPTRTPTPSPTRVPCSSVFGQCWPGPQNLCQAENGTVRSGTTCSGSTPICCVYNDLYQRCRAAGGQVVIDNYVTHVNESVTLFRVDSSRSCYRPNNPGCNIVDGGESTAAGCGCVDTIIPDINRSYCGGNLYCRGALQTSEPVVPQRPSTNEEIPGAGDWYVNTRDSTVRVYSSPYTSNNAYLGSTTINYNELYRYIGYCSGLPAPGGGGPPPPPPPPPTDPLVYTIRGNVFNDVDKDEVKDASEGKSWSGNISFAITPEEGTPPVVQDAVSWDSTAGTYQITGILEGTYRVSFTSGAQVGYLNLHPGGAPPEFRVTVGPGCTYTTQHTNPSGRATCNARGDISNLNFIITNSIPWFQVYGLDVRIDNGIIYGINSGLTNMIPVSPLYPAFMSVLDNLD